MEIILSNPLRRQIEWVMRAASDNETRPALTRIHIQNGKMEATDGFRVHRWKWELDYGSKKTVNALNDISLLEDGLYDFTISENPEGQTILVTILREETKYPDIDKVTAVNPDDRIKTKGGGQPSTAHFFVNNYFLKDAMNLRGIDGYPAVAHITVAGMIMRIVFTNGTEVGGMATAMLMLMHTDEGSSFVEMNEPTGKTEGSLFA